MAPDDHSGARPAGPVVLRIKLRYDDLDAMVQKFASNVGKSGLFLPTKSIQPVGTEVKFELRLANDAPVLVGMGRVKHVRPPDPDNPRLAFGMAIELMRVSREGREVIIRMIERRRAMGLADVAIPLPEDIEAARRAEVETVPKTDVTDVAREALAQAAAAPPGESVLVGKPASGPIGVAKTDSARPAAPSLAESGRASAPSPAESGRASAPSLMTAPRAGSSTMTGARAEHSGRIAVPVLAPEKSRSRRPRVQELIDKAAELSARIVVVPDLDMQIDVDSVLNRARTLAGGDLDAELDTLREAAAAPIEITIEAASAELARQLGGKAISKRDRSARWAPPPAVELRSKLPASDPIAPAPSDPIAPAPSDPIAPEPADTITSGALDPIAPAAADTITSAPSDTIAPATSEPSDTIAPDFSARTRAETEAAPSATIAAIVEAAVTAQSPALDVVETSQIEKVETSQIEKIETSQIEKIEPEPIDAAPESVYAAPELNTPVDASASLVPDEYDDAEAEYAADERTRYDQDVPPDTGRPAKFLPDVKTDPATNSGLMIDDDADILSFERALDAARIHTGVSTVAAPERPTMLDLGADVEESDLFPRVELPSSEPQLPDDGPDSTETATPLVAKAGGAEFPAISDQLAKQLDEQLAEAEAEAERDIADGISRPRHEEYGEESEEDSAEEISDLDVLAEADEDDEDLMGSSAEADASGSRPSVSDFAARLDLGDDDDDDDDLGDGVPPPPNDDFDRDAAREFDSQVPPVEDDYREPPPSYTYQRRRRPSSEQSSNYTIAEDSPPADLHFAPHPSGEDFDEPHRYGSAPSLPARGPDPRLLRHGRPTTEGNGSDLEDALAALDVGDIDLEQQRRMRRPTPSTQRPSRPLPGLPIERPKTGQAPVVGANTVHRDPARATGAQPIATPDPRSKPPTSDPRPNPPTAQHGTRPPPIPAAARKQPTQQVQIAKPPAQAPVVKRPPSEDDGVLIDFDDDE